jgi:hypothetical protein
MAEKILQCGYMSGDTYAAAAYLALNPDAKILLVNDSKEPQDKTGTIAKIYKECGVEANIRQLDLTASTLRVKELWIAVKDNYNKSVVAPAALGKDPTPLQEWSSKLYNESSKGWPRSITSVTGLVANRFKTDTTALQTVAKAWKIGKLPTEMKFALYEYMAEKFKKTGFNIRKNIVVLWSRQSGKTGGAHLEMDSSYTAIRQLARFFCNSATVLLTGDERDNKLADLATGSPHIIDISTMWEANSALWTKSSGEKDDSSWKQKFSGNTYIAQFAFYKYLAGDYNVIHLGMRSGMLESMALLGMTTFYMEPTVCGSGERMLAFNKANIPYLRIQIGALPGLTSRVAQQMIEKDNVPVATPRLVAERIRTTADSLIEQPGFLKAFGGYNSRSKSYYMNRDARASATQMAKVGAGGDNFSGSVTRTNLDAQVASMRGFLDSDLKKITDQVTSKFKL